MEYDPAQFRGAAAYYLRGRPPYSAELADVLTTELGLDGTGRLLDVGSGPGTVGVQLASAFEQVIFVEPDADMLSEARAHATAAGLSAVDFRQATAEDVAELGLPAIRVATFGQSFHRTDRIRAAEAVHRVLRPGGSMVLLSHDPSRPAPPQPVGTEPIPHEAIRALIRAYLGPELRSGSRLATSYSSERFEETLARTAFGPPRLVYARGRPNLIREVDDVVANYLSMSYAAPHLFGERLGAFVADLRALLGQASPSGRFWDWPGDTQIWIAMRH
jgi:ubiquinone/menaquinone biosynthesis C-methylase UbiE